MILLESIQYITSAPLFWGTMGFITAMAMFIGVILYDGKLSEVGKALVGILTYAGMLLWVTMIRLSNIEIGNHVQAYAGIVTILFVTLFWCLGLFVGVLMASIKGWEK